VIKVIKADSITDTAYFRFLRVKAATALARLSHHDSVCPSIRPSVHHTCVSVKNGAS